MQIITGEDTKVLRTKAEKVTVFDQALEQTVDAMIETMLSPQQGNVTGIGLAANQVGLLERIMIMTFNVNTKKEHKVVAMINPEILWQSEETVVYEEGCLSLPETFGKVRRASKIQVSWQNTEGHRCEKKLSGWDARVFLHEYDHLDGILFIDYLQKT
ncbi:MAG TPA: peptide deformylase [Candidatus Gracilibacteria bacterium]